MKKISVGLVFGGKSGEHEVSLQSAKSIYDALDKNKYEIHLIGIDKKGKWLLGQGSRFLLNSGDPKLIKLNQASSEIMPVNKEEKVALVNHRENKTVANIDVFFPIIHGTFGEDGSLQGLFELLDAAYVGAGVSGSAIGMDKDVQKRLLKQANIPVADFVVFRESDPRAAILKGIKEFGLPVFIKPACLGSSVGISKVERANGLEKAVAEALRYDNKILAERAIKAREIECSVLGNDNPVASVPGEVIPSREFYSYEAKYIDEKGAALAIPAPIDKAVAEKIRILAVKTFKALECAGMARVDFFLKDDGEVLVNEINTLPGFTKISMYPKLWEASGLSYSRLLDKLVSLALENKRKKSRLKRSYF